MMTAHLTVAGETRSWFFYSNLLVNHLPQAVK
jgi:hypothetical protein